MGSWDRVLVGTFFVLIASYFVHKTMMRPRHREGLGIVDGIEEFQNIINDAISWTGYEPNWKALDDVKDWIRNIERAADKLKNFDPASDGGWGWLNGITDTINLLASVFGQTVDFSFINNIKDSINRLGDQFRDLKKMNSAASSKVWKFLDPITNTLQIIANLFNTSINFSKLTEFQNTIDNLFAAFENIGTDPKTKSDDPAFKWLDNVQDAINILSRFFGAGDVDFGPLDKFRVVIKGIQRGIKLIERMISNLPHLGDGFKDSALGIYHGLVDVGKVQTYMWGDMWNVAVESALLTGDSLKCGIQIIKNIFPCIFFYLMDLVFTIVGFFVHSLLHFCDLQFSLQRRIGMSSVDVYDWMWDYLLEADDFLSSNFAQNTGIQGLRMFRWPVWVKDNCYTCTVDSQPVVDAANTVHYDFTDRIPSQFADASGDFINAERNFLAAFTFTDNTGRQMQYEDGGSDGKYQQTVSYATAKPFQAYDKNKPVPPAGPGAPLGDGTSASWGPPTNSNDAASMVSPLYRAIAKQMRANGETAASLAAKGMSADQIRQLGF